MKILKHNLSETTKDGAIVEEIILSNDNGMRAVVWSYGATLVSVQVPDKYSLSEEVSLCHRSLHDLIDNHGPYFGATIGRYANRISKGLFTLNGLTYQLPINNPPNSLHGGDIGFDQKVWTVQTFTEVDQVSVKLSIVSEDGDQGYPGKLDVWVSYTLTNNNEIIIEFHATTTKDTIVNMTNHTYWNISGDMKRDIKQHHLQLFCDRYLPVDTSLIPTGITSVKGTSFDFTSGRLIGDVIFDIDGGGKPGIDHCFVVDQSNAKRFCDRELYEAAILTDDISGRQLRVYTTQPGIQLYTGNFLSSDPSCFPFTQHNSICLETQHFPNSINEARFPSVILRQDEVYSHMTVFAFSISE